MSDYESELEYFESLYSKMNRYSDLKLLKSYLFELLNLNTANEIIGYYTATKKDNIVLKDFEEEMRTCEDVHKLKKKLLSSFIDVLLGKYNDSMVKSNVK